jgi:diadenylate cyclase
MNTFLDANSDGASGAFSNFFSSVKDSFSSFVVSDAIDILLLTVILFLAFRFFKSRKAGALLIGVAIIFVLTAVTFIFDLNATYFIFSSILDVGIIALLIILQPEIRDALEKVGTGSVNSLIPFGDQKKKRQMYSHAIDQICLAVNDLSRSKTGALIVISRTTKLDEIIETGISINADVNSFLLRNIFYDKAPLHDGAVVIDDARIAAAGCLLPLTRRTDIDGDLGTRHRAAIGMSETSDAIIIVVSEETGIISVAEDCTFTRNYTSESLRPFLKRKILRSSQDNEN